MKEEILKSKSLTFNYQNKIKGSRIGQVVQIKDSGEILIDFEENPLPDPLSARLGKPFGLDELKLALNLKRDLRLEFIDGNPTLPVIQNIYYSLLDEMAKKEETAILKEERILEIKGKQLIFDAEEIILRSSKKISLESGSHRISLNSMGKLVQKARNILLSATRLNKIKGGQIEIN